MGRHWEAVGLHLYSPRGCGQPCRDPEREGSLMPGNLNLPWRILGKLQIHEKNRKILAWKVWRKVAA